LSEWKRKGGLRIERAQGPRHGFLNFGKGGDAA